MGDALLLFNISRPQRLTELSNVTQMASRTLAGNSPHYPSYNHSGIALGRPKTHCLTTRLGYSNSTRIWFIFTASRGDMLTDFSFPAIGAVTLVSIFMASSTTIRSLTSSG